MRLDKFLSVTGTLSRSESKRAIRAGRVFVNSVPATTAELNVDPESDTVSLDGKEIIYRAYTYIMLNKPEGYVSATDDKRELTVLDLLPTELRKFNLFPCGRLDKNTLGLMLLTDDGELAHRLLAPKSHVTKRYRFLARDVLTESDVVSLESGVALDDGYVTKPAKIELDADKKGGVISLREGKYHQIKRMLEAVSNKITYLERISFGSLELDVGLARGEWRYLTPEEEDMLKQDVNKQ